MTRIQRIITAALAAIAAAIILLWTPAQETWGLDNTPPVISEPTSTSLQYLFPRGEKAVLKFISEPVTNTTPSTTIRFDFILTDDENDTTDPAGALFKVTPNGNNFEFTAKDGVTPEDFTALYGNVVSYEITVKMYASDGADESDPLSFNITAYHDASPRFQHAATYQSEQRWELDTDTVIEVYEGPQANSELGEIILGTGGQPARIPGVTDAFQIPWTSTTEGTRTWTLGNPDGTEVKCKDQNGVTTHTWDDQGSQDSALFAIDEPEGDQQQGHISLRFKSMFKPDYETPQDEGKDNEYLIRLVSGHNIHDFDGASPTLGCDGSALDLKVRVKDVGPPAPPTGLILGLQPNRPNHLRIHWDTPHANKFIENGTEVDFPDPNFNATSIVISHEPDGLQFRDNPLRNPSTVNARLSGVESLEGTPGVTYKITISLRNSEGDSTSVSEEIRLPGPPATPAAPTVRPEGDTSVTAAWKEPDDDGGLPITGYEVQYQKEDADDGAWTEWPHTGTGTSATITNLDEMSEYNVQVKAKNDTYASDWSPTGTGHTASLIVQIASVGNITSGNDAVFTVTLSKAATVTVDLTHTWTGGYGESTSGTLDFTDETSKNYTLTTARRNPEPDGGSVTVTIDIDDAYEIGTSGSATVDIKANEPPEFPSETDNRSVTENTESGQNIGAPFLATDPDTGDTLTYSLGGTDAASFDIDASTGQLQTKAALDYETKSSYTVTMTASDDTLTATVDVTVTITNIDEAGTVALSTNQPSARAEITAALTDPDEGVTGIVWQWERSSDGNTDWTDIGTSSPSYTPVDEDVGYHLRATASYTDGHGPGKTAQAASTQAVQVGANRPPEFDSATATREVPENTAAGQNIGAPFLATDPDADDTTLTYTLDGTDAASFGIVTTTGQLQTKSNLDFEEKTSYTVTVTATDQENLSDSIQVNITITNVDETPTVTGDSTINYAENGAGTVAAYTAVDPENGQITWSLSGDDSSNFSISNTGLLNFDTPPDYETPTDTDSDNVYLVTVLASNRANTASLDVTITVTDENETPVVAGNSPIDYPENSTGPVATYTAEDPENGQITWDLLGDDNSLFSISTSGVLAFKTAPDFEAPADTDHDNEYLVTVQASDRDNIVTLAVKVTVTNMNEPPAFASTTATRAIAENTEGRSAHGRPGRSRGPGRRRNVDLYSEQPRCSVL